MVVWDPFVLAAAPAHPLMRQEGPAAPDILNDAQVLLLDDGHCLRDQALAMCQRSGAREESFRATSLATLVQVVSGSQSVTLLPSLAVPVENRRAQIRTRPFAAPAPGRTVALAWRRQSPLGPALVAVARTCRAAIAPDHVMPGPAEYVVIVRPAFGHEDEDARRARDAEAAAHRHEIFAMKNRRECRQAARA